MRGSIRYLLFFATPYRVDAFVTCRIVTQHARLSFLAPPSPVQVHGVRSFLKKKFSRDRKKNPHARTHEPTQHDDQQKIIRGGDESSAPTRKDEECLVSVAPPSDSSQTSIELEKYATRSSSPRLESNVSATEETDSVVTVSAVLSKITDDDDAALDAEFSLPDPGRPLNKLEQEFRDMILDFTKFTRRDIRNVQSRQMRTLFEGVIASYSLPEVYRSFEVLFVDYPPIRVASRLIFGKLKQVMIDSQQERQIEVASVAASTGMTHADIEKSRTAFLKLVVHKDDKAATMTVQELVEYGLADTVVEVLGYQSFDEFVKLLDPKSVESIGFCELMVAFQKCYLEQGPQCNPATVLQEIVKQMEETKGLPSIDGDSTDDERKKRNNARYDEMLSNFREWKDLIPAGEGRRLDVLRGCFVGSKSTEVVAALRILYTDYSALRMSGDLIYKLASVIIGSQSTK